MRAGVVRAGGVRAGGVRAGDVRGGGCEMVRVCCYYYGDMV